MEPMFPHQLLEINLETEADDISQVNYDNCGKVPCLSANFKSETKSITALQVPSAHSSALKMSTHETINAQAGVTPKSSSSSTRNKYSIEYKLGILKILESNGGNVYKTARQTGIAERCIRGWRDEKEKLLRLASDKSSSSTRFRCYRRPHLRRGMFHELEMDILDWFEAERLVRTSVSLSDIQKEAKRLYEEKYKDEYKEFKASNGWIWNLIKRHSLQSKVTQPGSELTLNCEETDCGTEINGNTDGFLCALETDLLKWFEMVKHESSDNKVNLADIRDEARKLYENKYKNQWTDFKLSNSWMWSFIKRNGLSYRILEGDQDFAENFLDHMRTLTSEDYQSNLRKIQSSSTASFVKIEEDSD